MKLNLKYFGMIEEAVEASEEVIELDRQEIDLPAFIEMLDEKYSSLSSFKYQVSQNKKLIKKGILKDGDEIALLPPFAGG